MPRPVLFDRLDRATEGAVTLVVAPAGAGKTLGVAGWVRRTDGGRSRRARWVEGGRAVTAAVLEQLLDQQQAAAADHGAEAVVVVDDAQDLPGSALRFLDSLLSEPPDSVRIVLLSRWDLPLARLVPELMGHFTLLRGDLLTMSEEESRELVAHHAGHLGPGVVREVVENGRGWCAVLALTARSVAASPDPAAAARRYAVGEVGPADRAVSEVFSALTHRERHLLLCVSQEPVVTASSARRLTHDVCAEQTLSSLETTGLLVTRVDATDEAPREPTFRLHPLLVEAARRRLRAGGVDVVLARSAVRRAVAVDLSNGVLDRALTRLRAVHDDLGCADLLASNAARLVLADARGVRAFSRECPDLVEERRDTWFALALAHYLGAEHEAARHWLGRMSGHDRRPSPGPARDGDDSQAVCADLLRAHLGRLPARTAILAAEEHVRRVLADPRLTPTDDALVPLVLVELGALQSWAGALPAAERNLGTASRLCVGRDLQSLAATIASHLAMVQLLQGRNGVALDVAEQALALAHRRVDRADRPSASTVRARLVRDLARDAVLAAPGEAPAVQGDDVAATSLDPMVEFWTSVHRARQAARAGSVGHAQHLLRVTAVATCAASDVPTHLMVVRLVDEALLAFLSADRFELESVLAALEGLDADAPAQLVAGLRADLVGELPEALSHFDAAASRSQGGQPMTGVIALTCAAALSDFLGDAEGASVRLREALVLSEQRQDARAFLGWSRHGTPVARLLRRLAEPTATTSPWLTHLVTATAGKPDLWACCATTTATARERGAATSWARTAVALTSREREVLSGLARGATYADIASELFISENTVKTHVSSLYAKLGVARRSDALALARTQQLV